MAGLVSVPVPLWSEMVLMEAVGSDTTTSPPPTSRWCHSSQRELLALVTSRPCVGSRGGLAKPSATLRPEAPKVVPTSYHMPWIWALMITQNHYMHITLCSATEIHRNFSAKILNLNG